MSALLERGVELGTLERALDRLAAGQGAVVLVEGPAGIGKTGLLGAAAELAAERGLGVLRARGTPLERQFPFMVVRRLLERAARELAAARDGWPGWPAATGAAVIGVGEPTPGPADEGALAPVLHGLSWLLSDLADDRPLVLVVDDLHWADEPSLRFLDYLAERLDELPLLLVAGARPGEPTSARVLLEHLAASPHTTVVHPAALSDEAAGRLIEDRLGCTVDTALVAACQEATGGNPFLLTELAATIATDHRDGSTPDPAVIRTLSPETVSRVLLLRMAELPSECGPLATAVAVLGDDVDLVVATQLAGISVAAAAAAIDALTAVDILADGRPLNFTHPLIRSAVYADIGPGSQARLHLHAADLLLAAGAPGAQIAGQLLLAPATGRTEFADVLREVGAAAISRGAPEAAVGYLERALQEVRELRPDGELLCELGRAEFFVGRDPEAALEHLRAGIPLVADPARRAAAWLVAGRTTMNYVGVPEAVGVLDEALADLCDLDADARLRIEVERNCLGVTHAESHQAAVARIDAIGDTPAHGAGRLQLCSRAYRSGMDGRDLARTVELVEQALADGSVASTEGTSANVVSQALYVALFTDQLAEVRAQLETIVETERGRGSAWGVASALGMRAAVRYFAGDLAGCEADARHAIGVPGFSPFTVFCYIPLAWALVERGELDEADEIIRATGCGPEMEPIVHQELLLFSRGVLRAAQGRPAEAIADLEEYGARSDRVGAHNPGIPWRAHAALAYAQLGEDQIADELSADHLERAQRWGARSAVGIALRTRALVIGGAAAIDLLEAALAELAASPARLEHARALIDLGAAVRRAGRRTAARKHLQDGLEEARACQATSLVRRAHEELVASGARPRRLVFTGLEALTAAERRVAEMAAAGLANRAIAEQLFVTVRTVENHLTRAYAKLGIGSREGLPGAIAVSPR